MRKDGKSQYQLKKEKLQKIKEILNERPPNKLIRKTTTADLLEWYGMQRIKLWEIVKDEK